MATLAASLKGGPISPLLFNLYADQYVDRPFRRQNPDVTYLRYIDNCAFLSDSVASAQGLYSRFSRLVVQAELRLNEKPEEAIHVLGNQEFQWLGFRLSWRDDHFEFQLRDNWDDDLRESFLDCHRKPDSVSRADAVIAGIVQQAGPALTNLNWRRFYRRVAQIAAEHEFREIVPDDVFYLRCRRALTRWRAIRRSASHREGLADAAMLRRRQERRESKRGEFDLFVSTVRQTTERASGWACLTRVPADHELWSAQGVGPRNRGATPALTAIIGALQRLAPNSIVRIHADERDVCELTSEMERLSRLSARALTGRHIRQVNRLRNLVVARNVTWVRVSEVSRHHELTLATEMARSAVNQHEQRRRKHSC